MNLAIILCKQIAIMFVLMATGFIFFRKKMITIQGSADMGKILLYLVIPVVIVNSFWVDRSSERTLALVHSTIIAAIAMGIAITVSMVVFGTKKGVSCFSSAFSNAGFIGIPLVQAVLGSDAVFYISVMIVLINLLQWTFGVFVMTKDKSVMKPERVVRNPIVISVLIGLIIYFGGIPKPQIVTTLISNVTGLNTPLAMMVSGGYLAQSNLADLWKKKQAWFVCLMRLLIIPLITIAVFQILPFGSMDVKLAILIAAACPVGSNVAIFAQQYHCDYREAVEQVCLSTIVCLITLPFVTALSAAIF